MGTIEGRALVGRDGEAPAAASAGRISPETGRHHLWRWLQRWARAAASNQRAPQGKKKGHASEEDLSTTPPRATATTSKPPLRSWRARPAGGSMTTTTRRSIEDLKGACIDRSIRSIDQTTTSDQATRWDVGVIDAWCPRLARLCLSPLSASSHTTLTHAGLDTHKDRQTHSRPACLPACFDRHPFDSHTPPPFQQQVERQAMHHGGVVRRVLQLRPAATTAR